MPVRLLWGILAAGVVILTATQVWSPATADLLATSPMFAAVAKKKCASAAQCNDGNLCTVDNCRVGTCVNIAIKGCCAKNTDCEDGNPCTSNSCNPTKKTCNNPVQIPNCCGNDAQCASLSTPCKTAQCSQGKCLTTPKPVGTACGGTTNPCFAYTCQSDGSCLAGPIDCNDQNACTQDSCAAASGCTHVSLACDDADSCTTDSCDPAVGCLHNPLSCDDGNVCTDDGCSGGSCQHIPNTAVCDDNNAATISDRCADGTCQGSPMCAEDCVPSNPDGSCPAGYSSDPLAEQQELDPSFFSAAFSFLAQLVGLEKPETVAVVYSTCCCRTERACCTPNDVCYFAEPQNCLFMGDTPLMDTRRCEPVNPCLSHASASSEPANNNACCASDGQCIETAPTACIALGWTVQDGMNTCDPNPCTVAPVVCCNDYGNCFDATGHLASCDEGGLTVAPGGALSCTPNPCESSSTSSEQTTVTCCFTSPQNGTECQANYSPAICAQLPASHQYPNTVSCADLASDPLCSPYALGFCCTKNAECVTVSVPCSDLNLLPLPKDTESCTPNPCLQQSSAASASASASDSSANESDSSASSVPFLYHLLCCTPDNQCIAVDNALPVCEAISGQGLSTLPTDASSCTPNPCQQQASASSVSVPFMYHLLCCTEDKQCIAIDSELPVCEAISGQKLSMLPSDASSCTPNPCDTSSSASSSATHAIECCSPQGTCLSVSALPEETCANFGYSNPPDGLGGSCITASGNVTCPKPLSACCLPSGCATMSNEDCVAQGGSPSSEQVCSSTTCPLSCPKGCSVSYTGSCPTGSSVSPPSFSLLRVMFAPVASLLSREDPVELARAVAPVCCCPKCSLWQRLWGTCGSSPSAGYPLR